MGRGVGVAVVVGGVVSVGNSAELSTLSIPHDDQKLD